MDALLLFWLMCFCREHLIRLQHENKMLKLTQEGSDNEKIALLQSLLEDANRRKSELETENRSVQGTQTWNVGNVVPLLQQLTIKLVFIIILAQKGQKQNIGLIFLVCLNTREAFIPSVWVWTTTYLFPRKDLFLFCPSFLCSQSILIVLFRLTNQRLMEEQSQVEELQKTVQEQGSKADDVS